MPFRKKILYYALMLLLTLLALEGMARIAYYAAYGQGYGGGRPDALTAAAPALDPAPTTETTPRIRHPFYIYTGSSPDHDLNAMPPRQRRAELVVIGLLGGSVASEVQPAFQRALNRWFVENNLPRQAVVVNLSVGGAKQPQQTIIFANALLLGGEFDLMVNLDGFNETALSAENRRDGFFPFFPKWWHTQVGLTAEEFLRAGQIGALRREQGRLTAAGETSIMRRSAVFGLANRYRRERTAAQIIQRNYELAALEAAYSQEKYGPINWPETEELFPAAARIWYRGSLALARLAELGGAEYYHFLQPNQYVPNSKPLSAIELEYHYTPGGRYGPFVAEGYPPLLREFSRDLQSRGINYFDLTRIFVDRRETLYRDDCCHFNDHGQELLAAAMVERLEPALRRRAARPAGQPVSALAAARRPAGADTRLVDSNFQVYLQNDDRWLRYGRAECAAADIKARFFLHLTPQDLKELPPHRREYGFDNLDFSFAEVGGFHWRRQCQALLRLPDYPIAHLRTGQYAAGAGELWAADFPFPEPE